MADKKWKCVRFKAKKGLFSGENYELPYYAVKGTHDIQSALSYGDALATLKETKDFAEICTSDDEWLGALDSLEERAVKSIDAWNTLKKELDGGAHYQYYEFNKRRN